MAGLAWLARASDDSPTMALATSCPRCHTAFRVVPDQLKIRRGLVRCGSCRHVFSGIDSLRYIDEPAPLRPALAAPANTAAANIAAANTQAANTAAANTAAAIASLIEADPSIGRSAPPERAAPGESLRATATPPAAIDQKVDRTVDRTVDQTSPSEATLEISPIETPPRDGAFELSAFNSVAFEDTLPRSKFSAVTVTEPGDDADTGRDFAADDDSTVTLLESPAHDVIAPAACPEIDAHWQNIAGADTALDLAAATPGGMVRQDTYLSTRKPGAPVMYRSWGTPSPGQSASTTIVIESSAAPWNDSSATIDEPANDIISSLVSSTPGPTQGSAHAFAAFDEVIPKQERIAADADAVDFFAPPSKARGFTSRANAFAMVACLVLGLILALQSALAARDWLAARAPFLEPTLASLSGILGLQIQAPRSLDSLTLESFDLQASAVPGVLNMSALLRNRADHPVRWPALELTLTDGASAVIVRKVLLPADYLGRTQRRESVPSALEQNLSVALEGVDLQPTGYTVKLFYP